MEKIIIRILQQDFSRLYDKMKKTRNWRYFDNRMSVNNQGEVIELLFDNLRLVWKEDEEFETVIYECCYKEINPIYVFMQSSTGSKTYVIFDVEGRLE